MYMFSLFLVGHPVFGSTVAVDGPLFDVLGNGNGVVLDLGVPRLRDFNIIRSLRGDWRRVRESPLAVHRSETVDWISVEHVWGAIPERRSGGGCHNLNLLFPRGFANVGGNEFLDLGPLNQH